MTRNAEPVIRDAGGAYRAREYRERKRLGQRMVSIRLDQAERDALWRLGYLVSDATAAQAIEAFLSDKLGARR